MNSLLQNTELDLTFVRWCSLEGNNNFLGGGDDVTDFSSLMLDNRGGVENFFEGFDRFATGLTYS